jgi:hypothetical protein
MTYTLGVRESRVRAGAVGYVSVSVASFVCCCQGAYHASIEIGAAAGNEFVKHLTE